MANHNKFDIFNGNIKNPGELIFLYALIGILCIATLVFFALNSDVKSPADLQYASVEFARYEIDDDNLLLYANGCDQFYSIPGYRETLTDWEVFLSLCRDHTVFHVGYTDYPLADQPFLLLF